MPKTYYGIVNKENGAVLFLDGQAAIYADYDCCKGIWRVLHPDLQSLFKVHPIKTQAVNDLVVYDIDRKLNQDGK